MGDATKPFATVSNRAQIREILSSVYDSLMLKGYIARMKALVTARTHASIAAPILPASWTSLTSAP